MLYDPKWETDIHTLPSFISWLETMPVAATYDWRDCKGDCLIGQYMRAKGVGWYGDRPYSVFVDRAEEKGAYLQLIACHEPWTYGAALDRARASLAEGQAGK